MSYKTTKICLLFFFSVLALPFLNSCQSSSTDLVGDWVDLYSIDPSLRAYCASFAIGSKGYLGTGYNGTKRFNDFWEYDAAEKTWTQKADFPGAARQGAVGFATDTKGYIGTGRDATTKYKDFYEYDPGTNEWTRKADFGGSARYAAVGMVINNKCYIGTGFDDENYLKDFWEFDPETGDWTQKSSFGGTKRYGAACFVINGIGYIAGGLSNGSCVGDFYSYDPDTNQWSPLRHINNYSSESYDNDYGSLIVGMFKVGFAINGKGYLATGGSNNSSPGAYVWEYDPSTDLWTEKTSFEGTARVGASGFVIGNLGYVMSGMSSNSYLDDMWSFDPQAIYDQYDK
jgi:N-acetylneuraminic acid mutarotase